MPVYELGSYGFKSLMSVAVAFPCCVELLSFVKILVFALIKVLARFVIFDIFEHLTMACICN